MSINDEIEEYKTSQEPMDKEAPALMAWLHHNFAVIKGLLALVANATDLATLQTQVDALSSTITTLQALVDAIEIPEEFDPSALQAAIADLQAQIDAIPVPPPPPAPFVMPDGTDGQILTHGPGGNGDYFFAENNAITTIYAPAQTGDLIPVNEETEDEAILPEFLLTDDGAVMLIPVG